MPASAILERTQSANLTRLPKGRRNTYLGRVVKELIISFVTLVNKQLKPPHQLY